MLGGACANITHALKPSERPHPFPTAVEGGGLARHLRDGCRATPAAYADEVLSVSINRGARKQGCNDSCAIASIQSGIGAAGSA